MSKIKECKICKKGIKEGEEGLIVYEWKVKYYNEGRAFDTWETVSTTLPEVYHKKCLLNNNVRTEEEIKEKIDYYLDLYEKIKKEKEPLNRKQLKEIEDRIRALRWTIKEFEGLW